MKRLENYCSNATVLHSIARMSSEKTGVFANNVLESDVEFVVQDVEISE